MMLSVTYHHVVASYLPRCLCIDVITMLQHVIVMILLLCRYYCVAASAKMCYYSVANISRILLRCFYYVTTYYMTRYLGYSYVIPTHQHFISQYYLGYYDVITMYHIPVPYLGR